LTKPVPTTATPGGAGTDRLIPPLRTGGPHALWQELMWQSRLWALGAAILVLGIAYTPNFRELYATWARDADYSHGYLVISIALVILWTRLRGGKPEPVSVPVPWLSWLFLAMVLAVRALAYERNSQWLESVTMLPAIACMAWIFGGWPLLRRAWPAIAFLIFMLPLPQAVNNLVSLPLQRIAASGSCFFLQLSGLWSVQEGNVITLRTPHGMDQLDVARACSGLRMLMMLAATVAATIILIPLPTWQRISLLLSAVPIALLTNMIRIVATGWCSYLGWNKQLAHDWSGLLIEMPLGLALVWLELKVLSWLVPEEDDLDEKLIIPTLNQRKSGKNRDQQNAED
jgi:exosortase